MCQSVFADFFEAARQGRFILESPEQLIRLLATMARNHLLKRVEYLRAVKRDKRRVVGTDVADFELAADEETPSKVFSDQELLDLVRHQLSAEELQLAEGRAAGKSWTMLAAEVGGTPDRVRVRLKRALSKVRKRLDVDP